MGVAAGECEELRVSLDRVRTFLESLVVRGLRACGTDELGQLRAFAEELERGGAAHVASALAALHGQAERGEREAARTLLGAHTTVRLLERLLTLRAARAQYELAAQVGEQQGGDEAEEEEQEE